MARLAPEGPVYQAGTLSGNPVATTAGLTTLRLATDEVYERISHVADTLQTAAAKALTEAGVPHVVQVDRHDVLGVLHRASRSATSPAASTQDTAAYAAFFHAMLDAGVTCRRRRTRPGSSPAPTTTAPSRPCSTPCRPPPRRPPRPGRPRVTERQPETIVHLLRHGEVHNPEGVLYGRRAGLPPVRARPRDGRAGRRVRSATATSCTSAPRRSSGRRRPRAARGRALGLTCRPTRG